MTAITEFLFPAPAQRGTPAIMRWWEGRRLHYNLIVGTAGVFTLGIGELTRLLPPHAHHEGPPIGIIILYGVMANVCYCLGPISEVLLEKLFQRKVLPVGPTLYRMGLTFSLGLTLLPSVIFTLDWIRRVVFFAFSIDV